MTQIKRILYCVILAAVLMTAGVSQGGNLLFNSSFELGDKGYSGLRRCRVDDKGLYKYSGPAWVVDSTTAKYGSNSIRLDNPDADLVRFCSHEFAVVPGRLYTASFWAKSDREDFPFRVSFNALPWIPGKSDAVGLRVGTGAGHGIFKGVAGREWKRFSFAFTPGLSYVDSYYLNFETGRAWEKPGLFENTGRFTTPGTLWLDGMQIEEGALHDYAPAAPVEVAAYAPEIIVSPDSFSGELKAIAYNSSVNDFKVSLQLFDRHYRKTLETVDYNLDLKAGRVLTGKISFKSEKLGAFEIRTSLSDAATAYKSMAVVARVNPPLKSGDGKFTSGSTGSIDGVYGYDDGAGIQTFADAIGNPVERERTLRFLNSPVWRCWDTSFLEWSQIEPEQGRFNWNKSDRAVELGERLGIKLIPVIGSYLFNKKNTPEWARQRDRLGHPEGSEFPELAEAGGKIIPKTNLPRLEDWGAYIRAIATRYKGRIYAYEIFNEPYFNITAAYYVEYLKVACEEIKKADPDAIVFGICSTEDKNAMMKEFLQKCLRLGAGKYCDIITIHPYAGSMDDSAPNSAMDAIKGIQAAIKKETGSDKPVWDGECYFLRSQWDPAVNAFYGWDDSAIARRHIVDMGEGLAGSTPTHVYTLFKSEIHPGNFYTNTGRVDARLQPSEKFAVFNATGNMLNGASSIKRFQFPGVMCYTFKNHGKIWTAIWSLKHCGIAGITTPGGCKINVYDVFGNPINMNTAHADIELDRNPRYVEWNFDGGLAGLFNERPTLKEQESVIKAVEKTEVFIISNTGLFRKNGEWTVSVSLLNSGVSTLSNVKLSIVSPAFETALKPVIFEKMESGRTETVEVPVELKPGTLEAGVSFTIETLGRTIESKTALHPVESLDVYKGMMSASIPISRTVAGKIDSADDMSASFQAGYEEGDLLINVKVRDNIKSGKSAAAMKDGSDRPFDEDCIELFIDAMPLNASSPHYYQIFVSPHRQEGTRVKSKLKVKETVRELPDGYEVDMRIALGPQAVPRMPWLQGNIIRFDIAIDDSDSDSRKSQTVWSGLANNFQDRSGLGILRFKQTAQVRVDINTRGADGKPYRPRNGINDSVGPDWRKLSFSYIPEETGTVELQLLSGFRDHCWVYYRNIKAEGATLANGDLSKLDSSGNPTGWKLDGARLIKDNEFNCLKVNHDKPCVGWMQVESGKPVTVSYEARANDPPEPVESIQKTDVKTK